MKKLTATLILLSALIVTYSHADQAQELIMNGLIGAGSGAVAAGVSGGDAGKGAMFGAGAGIVGNVIADALTAPKTQPVTTAVVAQPQVVYVDTNKPRAHSYGPNKKNKQLETSYDEGYNAGYDEGSTNGWNNALDEVIHYAQSRKV